MSQELYETWMDRLARMNRPRFFGLLLARAGVDLDRALFGLLIRIATNGPIGVTELAELIGIDHSTASRQLARLEELDLIRRRPAEDDHRVREAALTAEGTRTVAAINQARREVLDEALAGWSERDKRELSRLTRRLTEAMAELVERELGGCDRSGSRLAGR